MILVRSILSWHLPIPLVEPLWLGVAAVVAAAVLLAAGIAVAFIDRHKTPTKH